MFPFSVSAFNPASLLISVISAPLIPSLIFANFSYSTPFVYIFAMFILIIYSLAFSDGVGTYISLSNLPGLNSAVSITSNLLVAATTITYALDSIPSISFNS